MYVEQDEFYKAMQDVIALEKESRKTLIEATQLQEALCSDSREIMADITKATSAHKERLLEEINSAFQQAENTICARVESLNNTACLMRIKKDDIECTIGEHFSRITNLLILFLGAAFIIAFLGGWTTVQFVSGGFSAVKWVLLGVPLSMAMLWLFFNFRDWFWYGCFAVPIVVIGLKFLFFNA